MFLFEVIYSHLLLSVTSCSWDPCHSYLPIKVSAFVNFLWSRLLQAAIGGFSSFFPDYKERITRHEAAHFLGNFRNLDEKSFRSRHQFMKPVDTNIHSPTLTDSEVLTTPKHMNLQAPSIILPRLSLIKTRLSCCSCILARPAYPRIFIGHRKRECQSHW